MSYNKDQSVVVGAATTTVSAADFAAAASSVSNSTPATLAVSTSASFLAPAAVSAFVPAAAAATDHDPAPASVSDPALAATSAPAPASVPATATTPAPVSAAALALGLVPETTAAALTASSASASASATASSTDVAVVSADINDGAAAKTGASQVAVRKFAPVEERMSPKRVLTNFRKSLHDHNGELTAVGLDLDKCREFIAECDTKAKLSQAESRKKKRCLLVLLASNTKSSLGSILGTLNAKHVFLELWLNNFMRKGFAGLDDEQTAMQRVSDQIKDLQESLYDDTGALTANGYDLERCKAYVKSEMADPYKVRRCLCVLAAAKPCATLAYVVQQSGLDQTRAKVWLERFTEGGFAALNGLATTPRNRALICEYIEALQQALHDANGELTSLGQDVEKCRVLLSEVTAVAAATTAVSTATATATATAAAVGAGAAANAASASSGSDAGAGVGSKRGCYDADFYKRCRCIVAATKPDATLAYIARESGMSTSAVKNLIQRFIMQGFACIEPNPNNSVDYRVLSNFLASLYWENGELTVRGKDLDKCRKCLSTPGTHVMCRKACKCILIAASSSLATTSINELSEQCEVDRFTVRDWLRCYTTNSFSGLIVNVLRGPFLKNSAAKNASVYEKLKFLLNMTPREAMAHVDSFSAQLLSTKKKWSITLLSKVLHASQKTVAFFVHKEQLLL